MVSVPDDQIEIRTLFFLVPPGSCFSDRHHSSDAMAAFSPLFLLALEALFHLGGLVVRPTAVASRGSAPDQLRPPPRVLRPFLSFDFSERRDILVCGPNGQHVPPRK